MLKPTINQLIQYYDVSTIEKHLIFSFINKKKLDFTKAPNLVKKLLSFEPIDDLLCICNSYEIKDIKSLESLLEQLIPQTDRKLNGAYFTPNYIIDFIINEVEPKESDKCLDPSCGCGAFLIGLVEYYKVAYNKSIKSIIRDNVFGADILDYNVDRAKTLLSILALQQGEVLEDNDFNIEIKDSLKSKWLNKFDVIVGNPPYVKYQDLDESSRLSLLNTWQTVENGTFNLYFPFFELGYELLESKGRLGYITPNNFFTSISGESLRKYFHNNKCVYKIIDFSHKKVFDAQTYTAITFINKQKNLNILYDKISNDEECSDFLSKVDYSQNSLLDLNVKKWRLLKQEEQENIRIIENIGTPIKNLFNIAAGIATLRDEVFFVDSQSEENGLFKKVTNNGVFYIEKEVTKPVYKISNFKNQKEVNNNTLRIITPYFTKNKTAIPIPEDVFRKNYPNCYNYLISEKHNLNNRDKGKNSINPFYCWGRTQGITRFGLKLINPTFSKHPRFLIVNEEDAYFTNGYGIYYSNSKNGSTCFDEALHPFSKEENILLLQKVLNSLIMDYYISSTSVSIQGGFPCYQKNFIEKFSIPSFTLEEIQLLSKLSNKDEIDAFLVEKYGVKMRV